MTNLNKKPYKHLSELELLTAMKNHIRLGIYAIKYETEEKEVDKLMGQLSLMKIEGIRRGYWDAQGNVSSGKEEV